MIIFIDTTKGDGIKIALKNGREAIAEKGFMAKYCQAEKLLPAIKKMLASKKNKLSNLTAIEVASEGDASTGFTALRIGVVTANALGYALGIPVEGLGKKIRSKRFSKFDITRPIYNKNPNITKQKASAVD